MRLRLIVIALLVSATLRAAAQVKEPTYSLTVHLTASRMILHGHSIAYQQLLSATIDGKKYELESISAVHKLLELGDYKARLVSDEHGKGTYDSWQVYELEFPDQKVRRYLVVGRLE